MHVLSDDPATTDPAASDPDDQAATDTEEGELIGQAGEPDVVASDLDQAGIPLHRGWAPRSGRHRWMEPFVLVLLAGGGTHGYAITAQLEEMGITGGPVDIGQVYRTLRDFEEAGQVTSSWSNEPAGPQRREYQLTDRGYAALDAWAAVMKERARLIGEFNGRYLDVVASPRKPA